MEDKLLKHLEQIKGLFCGFENIIAVVLLDCDKFVLFVLIVIVLNYITHLN